MQQKQPLVSQQKNEFQKCLNRSQNKSDSTDYNYQYFKQLMSVRVYRKQIQQKMQQLNQSRQKIYEKVTFYQKKTQQQFKDYIRGEAPQRKKRNRRNAEEIQRQNICDVCHKKYGSQGSLNQHTKLKHPSIYQPKKKSSKSQDNYDQNQED